MLVAGRVDYIPLSVIEAENVIARFPRFKDKVAIVPGLLLYYPFPVHFNVSKKTPLLAERLDYGLAVMQRDGSFEALFNQFFEHENNVVQKTDNRVFVLRNAAATDI
jgi:ABC-type amino acid transport substrate-binding protein